ncbi:MAG: hypothetical protein HYX52_01500 [Chloroflexi bacterium]|nr:hypothetical protein [Chloroflexota bacterium]
MAVTLWNRIAAALEGEVSADTLEAYQRAGMGVYKQLDEAEARRLECKIEGQDPWSVAANTQAELLCTWNAFVLQTLGDQFLEADYRANPATRGFVPPVTAEQALAFYGEVESWLNRASQAHSNPGFRLTMPLPADLPRWVEVEPCPPAHLEATLEAARAARLHAEAALVVFQEDGLPAEHQPAAQKLRQLAAEAGAKLAYGERLWASNPPRTLHQQIEEHAHRAVERYYHLGQLLAAPILLDTYDPSRPNGGAALSGGGRRLARPGEPGFDPWCLTDPVSRPQWESDPSARNAIRTLWQNDPAPARTLGLQEEIDAALQRGDIEYATGPRGQRLGAFYCCPWAPIYVTRRAVTLGGRRLRASQQFTLDVSAEDMLRGGAFKREVMLGNFSPTDRVDYCDPTTGGHDD